MHGSSPGALPSCYLWQNSAFGPPKPSCINRDLLHGDFTGDLGLLHTEIPSQCGATRSCVGVSCHKSSSRPGTGGSSGLRFRSCAKLNQADCNQINVSRLKGLCSHSHQVLQLCCRGSGARGESMDGWVSISSKSTLVSHSLMLETSL